MIQAEALERQRETERRCSRWETEPEPRRCFWRRTKAWKKETETELHPPRVSITRGIKETPTDWQAFWWRERFLTSMDVMAWPWTEAAVSTVRRWRGEVTTTSNAVGRPCCQLGRNMSAGREDLPGIWWPRRTPRIGADYLGPLRIPVAVPVRTHFGPGPVMGRTWACSDHGRVLRAWRNC